LCNFYNQEYLPGHLADDYDTWYYHYNGSR
jgi:hypothetical protein